MKFIGFLTPDLLGMIELDECPVAPPPLSIILSISFGGEVLIEFFVALLPRKLSLFILIDSNLFYVKNVEVNTTFLL